MEAAKVVVLIIPTCEAELFKHNYIEDSMSKLKEGVNVWINCDLCFRLFRFSTYYHRSKDSNESQNYNNKTEVVLCWIPPLNSTASSWLPHPSIHPSYSQKAPLPHTLRPLSPQSCPAPPFAAEKERPPRHFSLIEGETKIPAYFLVTHFL